MARERYDDERDDDFVDDRPVRRSGQMGPLDGMYANTNIVVLILFGVCCGLIAFVLSLVAFLTAKDPKAKSNAMLVLIVSGVLSAIGIVLQFAGILGGAAVGNR